MKNTIIIIIGIIGSIALLIIGGIFVVSRNSKNIPDGYIAVFHGGVGEITYQTYIYRNNNEFNGYKYINETCNTVRYGSPEWKCKITDRGKFEWTDEAFKIAKKNGAYSYVTRPNDEKTYTIEEFKKIFHMN